MNKQLIFSVMVVVLTTSFASLIVDHAYANKVNRQSINNGISQSQTSTINPGANSPGQNSASQTASASITNNGGNSAFF
jgi:hypothetical protein